MNAITKIGLVLAILRGCMTSVWAKRFFNVIPSKVLALRFHVRNT